MLRERQAELECTQTKLTGQHESDIPIPSTPGIPAADQDSLVVTELDLGSPAFVLRAETREGHTTIFTPDLQNTPSTPDDNSFFGHDQDSAFAAARLPSFGLDGALELEAALPVFNALHSSSFNIYDVLGPLLAEQNMTVGLMVDGEDPSATQTHQVKCPLLLVALKLVSKIGKLEKKQLRLHHRTVEMSTISMMLL
jgi:hypothetical protein